MGYEILSHAADTGIEATAPTFEALVHELAQGMFALVAELEPAAAERWIEVDLTSATLGDLVVDVLSELLYRSEVDDIVFCAFEVDHDPEAGAVRVRAGGVPVRSLAETGAAIKAVTYHDLVVDEQPEGPWFARVYFDV